jgi:N-formylglutamate amidohydrolase
VWGVDSSRGKDHSEDGQSVIEPELKPPFEILQPTVLMSGLVCNSPHSGRVYPASFLASARLDPLALRRSEDAFVDELFFGAVAVGAPLMRAHFPRAYLDVNREPYELDPRMFDGRLPPFANTRSMRVAAGLGTIARLVGEAQEIYARRLSIEEAVTRIETLYKPYHRGLRGLIQRAERQFGVAVLLDCHSMPSASNASSSRDEKIKADVVVGDRFGTSCAAIVIDFVEQELRRQGYSVLRNRPYAGGFITEHYGNPAAGHHALQIEVNRALYMDEGTLLRSANFDKLTSDLTRVLQGLAQLATADLSPRRAAAE